LPTEASTKKTTMNRILRLCVSVFLHSFLVFHIVSQVALISTAAAILYAIFATSMHWQFSFRVLGSIAGWSALGALTVSLALATLKLDYEYLQLSTEADSVL